MSKPWERQEAEPDQAWAGFVSYRDLGPKRKLSLVEVAQRTPPMVELREWHKTYRWDARARQYDAWVDKVRLKERERLLTADEKDAYLDRRVLYSELREVIAKETDKLRKRLAANDMGELSPKEILQCLDLLVKLERLEGGQATDRVEVSGVPGGLSDSEFAELEDLLKKAGKI